jgi:phage terminase small subunit
MANLTAKQAAFCREYIVDCNGTQAAIRAGSSERTAQEQAAQMLAKPHIDAEVARLQAEVASAAKITVQTLPPSRWTFPREPRRLRLSAPWRSVR